MCSRSGVHKLSDLWLGTKGNLRIFLLNTISCGHGAAHAKLLLSDCVRNTIEKGVRNADFWNVLETVLCWCWRG